jgi:hypothetical protein
LTPFATFGAAGFMHVHLNLFTVSGIIFNIYITFIMQGGKKVRYLLLSSSDQNALQLNANALLLIIQHNKISQVGLLLRLLHLKTLWLNNKTPGEMIQHEKFLLTYASNPMVMPDPYNDDLTLATVMKDRPSTLLYAYYSEMYYQFKEQN